MSVATRTSRWGGIGQPMFVRWKREVAVPIWNGQCGNENVSVQLHFKIHNLVRPREIDILKELVSIYHVIFSSNYSTQLSITLLSTWKSARVPHRASRHNQFFVGLVISSPFPTLACAALPLVNLLIFKTYIMGHNHVEWNGQDMFLNINSIDIYLPLQGMEAFLRELLLEWCRDNSIVWENPVKENTTHYTVEYTCKRVLVVSYHTVGCKRTYYSRV